MLIPALVELNEIVSLALKQYPAESDRAYEFATSNLNALSSEEGYELLRMENYYYNAEKYIEYRIFS